MFIESLCCFFFKDADGHKRTHILKQNLNKVQLEKESHQLSYYGVEEKLNLCLRSLLTKMCRLTTMFLKKSSCNDNLIGPD